MPQVPMFGFGKLIALIGLVLVIVFWAIGHLAGPILLLFLLAFLAVLLL